MAILFPLPVMIFRDEPVTQSELMGQEFPATFQRVTGNSCWCWMRRYDAKPVATVLTPQEEYTHKPLYLYSKYFAKWTTSRTL